MRVLCVCLGNICRSPTAEAVIRHLAPEIEVDSAGTSDWHIGEPPYGPAIVAAAERGYDLSPLRARRFEPSDFTRFDLILAMDRENVAEIEARRPSGNKTPVQLFLDHAEGLAGTDVPDPYYTRNFDEALDLVERAASGLVHSLRDS